MGWSDAAKENTRQYLGSGGPVKNYDGRTGIADVWDGENGRVEIYEHANGDPAMDNGVLIDTYSDIEEMMDDGWVID